MLAQAPFTGWLARCESALEAALPAAYTAPTSLHAAMRHAALGSGKRLRPLLVYAGGEMCGAPIEVLDRIAVAIELIHAYSLVHDDLPAMDDDDLRRGRPTVHVLWDEATAILVGDALQSLAFAELAAAPATADVRIELVEMLARAAGSTGMCGGQALDLAATGRKLTLADLEALHRAKTGALIEACLDMAAAAGGAGDDTRTALHEFAEALGLAFQIRDDLLDVEGDTVRIGKTAGKDAAQGKPTFPALLGVDTCRARLHALERAMQQSLAPFAERGRHLASIATFVLRRDH